MNEIAVSNSTCLIALERINRLNILAESFQTIMIPPAVSEEVGFEIGWLIVKPVKNKAVITSLNTQIDIGESEAIALAMELKDVYVLLDDKKARRIAKQIKLKVIGTIGLLLRAKRKGIIKQVKPILDELQNAGFRLTETLYKEALHLAEEK